MAPQTPTVPNTALYQLVAERLGRDPLEFIRELRELQPPTSYARIADEIKSICNADPKRLPVYITHEVPRRWLLATAADTADPAAPPDSAAA
jgi:hypothetical protein